MFLATEARRATLREANLPGSSRPPGRQDPADFVLKDFSATERKELDLLLAEAVDALRRTGADFAGLVRSPRTWAWLVLGAALWWFTLGGRAPMSTGLPGWQLLVGGALVGYGARLGNGCTSGHGICGLGSLQGPSLVAVLTFMATAFLTANAVLALKGA